MRPRQQAFQRNEIKRTAAAVLREDGCDGMTVEKVASVLRISKATVYKHFRSRDDLIREILADAAAALLDSLPDAGEEDALRSNVTSVVKALLDEEGGLCCLARTSCPFRDSGWAEVAERLDAIADASGGERSGPLLLSDEVRAMSAVCRARLAALGEAPDAPCVRHVVRRLLTD